jgi:hypothetical protein
MVKEAWTPSRELLRWRTIVFGELLLSENYYGIRDPGILVERVFILSLLVSKRVALNIKEFI